MPVPTHRNNTGIRQDGCKNVQRLFRLSRVTIQPLSVFWYLQLLQGQADVPAVPFKK